MNKIYMARGGENGFAARGSVPPPHSPSGAPARRPVEWWPHHRGSPRATSVRGHIGASCTARFYPVGAVLSGWPLRPDPPRPA
jgi:hypothetical protein